METVAERIFELRGQRIMLDVDLAVLYGVETRAIVQAVKRNPERFPPEFMFQLTSPEWEHLRSQNVISNGRGGRRFTPYAFTEHGALMLSSVLKSMRATEISLLVIRAFVWLRQIVPAHKELADRLTELEHAVSGHDKDIATLLSAMRQLVSPPQTAKRRIGF
jgi:hypothetical protein